MYWDKYLNLNYESIDVNSKITIEKGELIDFKPLESMHNHIRMYVSSLICNFSNTHFLNPSKWLYYHLLDGDVASNCLNWQWVSGASRNKKYFFFNVMEIIHVFLLICIQQK